MFRKLSIRVISITVACLTLACSLPLALIISAQDDTPVNVFLNNVDSVKGVVMNTLTGEVFDHNQFNGSGQVFGSMFDGNTNDRKDVYGANDWGNRNSGAFITLDDTYYCGDLKIFSGYTEYPDTYKVYASDTTDDLYSSDNSIENIVCTGSEKSVHLNRDVKYIAVFLTDYVGNGRLAEIQLWTADKQETPEFKSENLLKTALSEATGILYNTENGSYSVNSKFNENGAIAGSTDGNTVNHIDVYGWNETTKVGVIFTLDDTYYSGKAAIVSGLAGYPDYWNVYASDDLDTLFDIALLNNAKCENEKIEVEINAKVKYIAFVFASDGGRVKELELWSAEDTTEKPFEPANILSSYLESSNGILMETSTGTVTNSTRFGTETIAKTVDGDTATHYDVYGALDWDTPYYVGALYCLSVPVYVSHTVIYSGFDAYPDTYRVYASASLTDLFTDDSIIGDGIVCGDAAQTADINDTVQYIAFVCTNYVGNQRVKEFELWSAEKPAVTDPETPPEPAKATRVLTIGNSFAENASIYASDIAEAQDLDLVFGYLKYPSCTLSQHYENAINKNEVYKFAYTDQNSPSTRHTVKDGSNEKATIDEALDFAQWDIVVIQQGSMASYDYSTYEKAPDLIAYIKSKLPTAEIMIHETWSWATWAADNNTKNDFRIIENCYHQLSGDNGGLTIIPSGRAFEFARKEGLNVNDSDNQHANQYGQYLAGACYVASIFGADINENTFGNDHPAFSGVDMNVLRKAVSDAMKFNYDPATNWDWTTPPVQEKNDNFISAHLEASTAVIQNVATGVVAENTRFSAANADAVNLAIDGDVKNSFEVWGAHDWEYPQNVGVMYMLDGIYILDSAVIYGGTGTEAVKIDIYASETAGNLYSSRIETNINCSGEKVTVKIGKKAKYLAFIVTDYNEGTSIQLAEFDVTGDGNPVKVEKIEWPKAPAAGNILKSAKATKIIAPGGDYLGSKEYDYGFMDADKKDDLSRLTDGNYGKHYDIWSLTAADKPGVMYELDAYYDISHIHAFAGAADSALIVNNGYKVYASEKLSDLYKTKSLVYSYKNDGDTTNEIGLNTNLSKIRYIAFFLTNSSDGGWRMREFEAYGSRSADQTAAVEATSIIEGIDAEYYGVATDNLADPVYMGASNFVFALTDGSRDPVEFWGGADVNNTKFVFIYNLYENFDLSGVDIYASADAIEEDSGIHKGIKSAKVYASRKFDDLFNTKPLVLKEGYEDASGPDENAYYSADAQSEWKGVRYIAYVFTIGDSRYGACRLEELKAFGKLSAVQDVEEEEKKLPAFIDVKADNGVIARIFALSGTDDLAKLGANLKVDVDDSQKSLEFVNDSLPYYTAKSIYKVCVVDASGSEIDLGGRIVRLSIPVKDKTLTLACVDDYGAEIVSTGLLNDCLTVETATLRSYALVEKAGGLSVGSFNVKTLLWTAAVITSVVSAGFVIASAFVAIKLFKK